MNDTIFSTRLRDKVLHIVRNRPVHMTLKKISEDTSLPLGWLKMFAQGKIDDPSCNRIETLYEYLCGEQLKV